MGESKFNLKFSYNMSHSESEPLIQTEEFSENEIEQDDEIEYVLEGKFSERVTEHPLENLDIDRLLVERLGEFGRYQKVTASITT